MRSNVFSTSSGILRRDTPWNPSQPAMKSHRRSCSAPPIEKLTLGAVEVKSCSPTFSAQLVHHRATGFGSCVEILRDRGLAISHHAAACVPVGIYEELRAILPGDHGAIVKFAFRIHASAEADGPQQLHSTVFKHASADPFQYVRLRLSLNHHIFDAIEMQQVR